MLAVTTGVEAKSLHPDHKLIRGEVQQYGDWLVGCDNQAECTLFGIADADSSAIAPMAIRVSFTGGGDEPPIVELFPQANPADRCLMSTQPCKGEKPANFKLNVKGTVAAQLYGYAHSMPATAETEFIMAALESGKTLTGINPQTTQDVIRFPQKGYSAAMRAMHARRKVLRRRLADEAIDNLPGELPDCSNMPVYNKLTRIPAIETMVSGFVPILADGRCGNDFMVRPRQFGIASGQILWSFECHSKSGPTRTLWDMATGPNAIAIPLELPEPREGKIRAGVDGLEAATFDWDFGVLRSYKYLNGREDCGTFRAWSFTTNGWHLLERREMPLCKGLPSKEWIRTYYAPTDGAGPDE